MHPNLIALSWNFYNFRSVCMLNSPSEGAKEADPGRSCGVGDTALDACPFLLAPFKLIVVNGHLINQQNFAHAKTYVHAIVIQNHLEMTSFKLLTLLRRYPPELNHTHLHQPPGLSGLHRLQNCLPEGRYRQAKRALPDRQQSYPKVKQIFCSKTSSIRPLTLPPSTFSFYHCYLWAPASSIYPTIYGRQSNTHRAQRLGFQHQNAAISASLAHLFELNLLPPLGNKITPMPFLKPPEHKLEGPKLADYSGSQLMLNGAHNRASNQLLGNIIRLLNGPLTPSSHSAPTENLLLPPGGYEMGHLSPPHLLVAQFQLHTSASQSTRRITSSLLYVLHAVDQG
ncbi:hypothetical protein PtA15_4A709 [Puccinia triticina]|uniref:Uncharacterized protein n=1 Tax=Puccinia triticina TaxID=208348 RepID=A0ABY7CGA8_9BASI|nr:uncharacterized protein PtA15_4A709 [Puccinia triticina]WAQ84256.1 hypothetical protein PtA15_4A709 [Puccinia triticina]